MLEYGTICKVAMVLGRYSFMGRKRLRTYGSRILVSQQNGWIFILLAYVWKYGWIDGYRAGCGSFTYGYGRVKYQFY